MIVVKNATCDLEYLKFCEVLVDLISQLKFCHSIWNFNYSSLKIVTFNLTPSFKTTSGASKHALTKNNFIEIREIYDGF